jgi:hypothetical protein
MASTIIPATPKGLASQRNKPGVARVTLEATAAHICIENDRNTIGYKLPNGTIIKTRAGRIIRDPASIGRRVSIVSAA